MSRLSARSFHIGLSPLLSLSTQQYHEAADGLLDRLFDELELLEQSAEFDSDFDISLSQVSLSLSG